MEATKVEYNGFNYLINHLYKDKTHVCLTLKLWKYEKI
jgi:hypothetical protein